MLYSMTNVVIGFYLQIFLLEVAIVSLCVWGGGRGAVCVGGGEGGCICVCVCVCVCTCTCVCMCVCVRTHAHVICYGYHMCPVCLTLILFV